MAIRFSVVALLALAALVLAVPAATAQSVPAGPGKQWNPTWGGEFNAGPSDLAGWSYDLGTGQNGWGNWETQSYTNSPTNVSVAGGALHLTAVGTTAGANTNYTSGRIRTTSLFTQAYGLFEIRAKLPAGQGLWPAVWMMPAGNAYGGWPTSGEIDIMESTGHNTGKVQGTLHSGTGPGAHAMVTGSYQPAGFDTTQWHTYSLKWTAGATASQPATFQWFVDGTPYQTRTGGWVVPAGATNQDAPFDKPFYLILNLAVGGTYADHLTPGPGSYDMQVDFARAYQLANVPEPAGLAVLAAALVLCRRSRRVGSIAGTGSRPHPLSFPGGHHVQAH